MSFVQISQGMLQEKLSNFRVWAEKDARIQKNILLLKEQENLKKPRWFGFVKGKDLTIPEVEAHMLKTAWRDYDPLFDLENQQKYTLRKIQKLELMVKIGNPIYIDSNDAFILDF